MASQLSVLTSAPLVFPHWTAGLMRHSLQISAQLVQLWLYGMIVVQTKSTCISSSQVSSQNWFHPL